MTSNIQKFMYKKPNVKESLEDLSLSELKDMDALLSKIKTLNLSEKSTYLKLIQIWITKRVNPYHEERKKGFFRKRNDILLEIANRNNRKLNSIVEMDVKREVYCGKDKNDIDSFIYYLINNPEKGSDSYRETILDILMLQKAGSQGDEISEIFDQVYISTPKLKSRERIYPTAPKDIRDESEGLIVKTDILIQVMKKMNSVIECLRVQSKLQSWPGIYMEFKPICESVHSIVKVGRQDILNNKNLLKYIDDILQLIVLDDPSKGEALLKLFESNVSTRN